MNFRSIVLVYSNIHNCVTACFYDYDNVVKRAIAGDFDMDEALYSWIVKGVIPEHIKDLL